MPAGVNAGEIVAFRNWYNAALAAWLKSQPGADDPRDPEAFRRYLKALGCDPSRPNDYGAFTSSPKPVAPVAVPWTRDLRAKLNGTYEPRPLSGVRYLVIHHSAVAVDSTAESIADYHVRSLGWPGIGYHFVVHWDGSADYCGDISLLRYNVAARNGEAVGICIPGDWTSKMPPDLALSATRRLVAWLRDQLPGSVEVVGHREIATASPTACPGATWPSWRTRVV